MIPFMCCAVVEVSLNNDPSSTILLSPRVAEHARYITRNVESEYDKALLLFRWLAQNVQYDVNAAQQIDDKRFHQWQSPETVLRRGKAVCQGYAGTFAEFLNAVNIENVIVHGHARNSPKDPLEPHTWNALRIDGHWFLSEATWAAGGVHNGLFKPDYSEDFFIMNPSDAIKTHLPDDPLWQLSEDIVSFDSFMHGQDMARGQKFNLQKTLADFKNQDVTARHKAGIERALNYNPSNGSALFEKALMTYNQANVIAKRYEQLTIELNKPHEFVTLRAELFDLLNEQERLLNNAAALFQCLQSVDKYYAQAVQENLHVLRSVKKNINFERRFLSEL